MSINVNIKKFSNISYQSDLLGSEGLNKLKLRYSGEKLIGEEDNDEYRHVFDTDNYGVGFGKMGSPIICDKLLLHRNCLYKEINFIKPAYISYNPNVSVHIGYFVKKIRLEETVDDSSVYINVYVDWIKFNIDTGDMTEEQQRGHNVFFPGSKTSYYEKTLPYYNGDLPYYRPYGYLSDELWEVITKYPAYLRIGDLRYANSAYYYDYDGQYGASLNPWWYARFNNKTKSYFYPQNTYSHSKWQDDFDWDGKFEQFQFHYGYVNIRKLQVVCKTESGEIFDFGYFGLDMRPKNPTMFTGVDTTSDYDYYPWLYVPFISASEAIAATCLANSRWSARDISYIGRYIN